MSPARPPRLADLILRLALGNSPTAQSIRGDLHEEYRLRVQRASAASARRWFGAQAFGVTLRAGSLRAARRGDRTTAFPGRQTPGTSRPTQSLNKDVPMTGFFSDLRYGARSLLGAPVYTGMALLTLTMGIGATVSIFSVVNTVLLQPLPYEDSEQLVRVGYIAPRALCERYWGGNRCDRLIGSSAPMLNAWRERTTLFDGMAGDARESIVLLGDQGPRRYQLATITEDYFPILRVEPTIGRIFAGSEYDRSADVAVISHELWRDLLGQVPDVLGKQLVGVDRTLTIIGVLPAGFAAPSAFGGASPQIFTPFDVRNPELSDWNQRSLSIHARVASGATIEAADADLAAVAATLGQEVPALTFEGDVASAGARSLHEETVGRARTPLYLFLAAVGALLLIGCTNVANLTLARGTLRTGEMAVRSALGAGQGRILRQLLVESVLLGLLGGAGGTLLAYWATKLIVLVMPLPPTVASTIAVDLNVVGFAVTLSVLAGVASGLLPALRLMRTEVADALRGVDPHTTESPGMGRVRSSLVVVQIALALVLLVGAGLLFNSFLQLRSAHPGFEPAGAAALYVSFPAGQDSDAFLSSFLDEVLDNAASIPGIETVALAMDLPLNGISWRAGLASDDAAADSQDRSANGHIVSPGYFTALGIELLSGRRFDERDARADATSVIVNRALANTLWPGKDAAGHQIQMTTLEGTPWYEVVGVVEDVRQDGLRSPIDLSLYVTYQRYEELTGFGGMYLVARYPGELDGFAGPMRQAVWNVDDRIPLPSLSTLTSRVEGHISSERVTAGLLGVFAVAALALAVAGIYGTMVYAVGQRRREVGIRMALGAASSDVQRLVLKQGGRTTAIGLAFGLAGSLVLARGLASVVYGISPTDPTTFAVVIALLGGVSLLACWLPARRASRIDPARVLRADL